MGSRYLGILVIGAIALTGVLLVGAKERASTSARVGMAPVVKRVATEIGTPHASGPVATASRVAGATSPAVARERSNATTDAALGRAAFVVATDPQTGALTSPERTRGSALTLEELQTLARREAEGLVTIRNADGSETLNHEGRFAEHSVIRIGPDGKPLFRCVQGDHGVDAALDKTVNVRSSSEKE